MNFKKFAFVGIAVIAIAACGQAANGSSDAAKNNDASPKAVEDAAPIAFVAQSGVYTPDDRHRHLLFNYSHFGFSNSWVRWRSWDATLNWNAENPEASTISVVIDATAVDSGVDVFDDHLNGERFFDTAKFPQITFQSTSVKKTGADTGTVTGDLTIKGVTKPVTLDVKFNKDAFDEKDSSSKIGFSGTTSINRSDFGIDFLVPNVGDNIDIVIEAEFKKSGDASQ